MLDFLVLFGIIGMFLCAWIIKKELREYKEWKKYKKYKSDEYHYHYHYNHQNQQQKKQPEQQPVNNEQDESYSSDFNYSYMPYKKAHLLTKTEYIFFVTLLKECNKRKLMVCPKVRLEDVAYVTDKNNRLKYRGYVKSRHIDFILVNMRCETIAGVELDDPSHETEKAAKTDKFKNELFKTIGVPLIRIKTGTDYASQIVLAFDHLNLTGNITK